MHKKLAFLLPLLFLIFQTAAQNTSVSIRIMVRDAVSGEPLVGASVLTTQPKQGTITDATGSVIVKSGTSDSLEIKVSYPGYDDLLVQKAIPVTGETIQLDLQPTTEGLEEITIQSTRTNSRLEDSPTKVEVLGREDMDEENNLKPNNVASILGDYSGIQIQQTGLSSGNAAVRIQGLAGRYTQILKDGLPVYSGLSGDFGILQIQPLDLQQIELIKGPSSTLFGGGAIAGVINFISKTPGAKPEHSITLNQTTLGETNSTVWFSGKNKKTGYTFFGGATHQSPRDIDGDGFTDISRINTTTLHPRIFLYPNQKNTIAIGVTVTAENRMGGDFAAVKNGATMKHPYFEKNTIQRIIGDINYRYTTAHGEWTGKAAFSTFERNRQVPDWLFKGRQQDWFSELTYRQTESAHFRWVAGVNYRGNAFEKGQTDSLQFSDFQNHTIGAFGQTALQFGKLNVELGLRTDYHTRFGLFVLPTAAALYHISTAFSVRAGLGWGYATPNPLNTDDAENDLRRVRPLADGLDAEHSLGGNLEWNYHQLIHDRFTITFNQQFFHTQFQKPLVQKELPGGDVEWVIADKPVTTMGVDNYFRLDFDATEIYLGYTYQLAKQTYKPAQPYITLTPRHRAATVVAQDFGDHFRAGIEGAWTGYQVRDDGSHTIPYWFVAAMAGYKAKKFDVVLNCENLFDFRQTRHERVVLPPYSNPQFVRLWAPVDGRAVNLAVVYRW